MKENKESTAEISGNQVRNINALYRSMGLFRRFPAELRNEIYKYVLAIDLSAQEWYMGTEFSDPSLQPAQFRSQLSLRPSNDMFNFRRTSILHACCLIYKEAFPIMEANIPRCEFTFSIEPSDIFYPPDPKDVNCDYTTKLLLSRNYHATMNGPCFCDICIKPNHSNLISGVTATNESHPTQWRNWCSWQHLEAIRHVRVITNSSLSGIDGNHNQLNGELSALVDNALCFGYNRPQSIADCASMLARKMLIDMSIQTLNLDIGEDTIEMPKIFLPFIRQRLNIQRINLYMADFNSIPSDQIQERLRYYFQDIKSPYDIDPVTRIPRKLVTESESKLFWVHKYKKECQNTIRRRESEFD